MKEKSVLVSFRLPQPTAELLHALAKLAGVSVDDVIRIAIATEVLRYRAQENGK